MIKSLRLEMKSLKGSESSILNELGYKISAISRALLAKPRENHVLLGRGRKGGGAMATIWAGADFLYVVPTPQYLCVLGGVLNHCLGQPDNLPRQSKS